jgi:hypothetical protein
MRHGQFTLPITRYLNPPQVQPFLADWHKIGEQRQSLTNHGNQHENAKRIDYNYKVEDKVLLINEGILCKAESAYNKEP